MSFEKEKINQYEIDTILARGLTSKNKEKSNTILTDLISKNKEESKYWNKLRKRNKHKKNLHMSRLDEEDLLELDIIEKRKEELFRAMRAF